MRGLAIIFIMLHNYCHLFSFAIKESEFEFKLDQTCRWGSYILNPDINLPVNILSTFGFYLLPAFMFLGGYGLVRKYEQGDATFKAGRFVINSWRKLLALVFIPQLVFIAMLAYVNKPLPNLASVITQFGMVNNIAIAIGSIEPALSLGVKINPFIYWYLGMMMQLYVVYALIHNFQGEKSRFWVPVGLILLGYAAHLAFPQGSIGASIVRYNGTVGFIPFGLGILAARYGHNINLTTRRAAIMLPLLLVIVIANCFNYYCWGLNYAFGAMLAICCAVVMRGKMLQFFVAVGKVSALVYVLHPLTRWIIIQISGRYFRTWTYTQLLLYIVLTVVVVCAYKKLGIDRFSSRFIAGKKQV